MRQQGFLDIQLLVMLTQGAALDQLLNFTVDVCPEY